MNIKGFLNSHPFLSEVLAQVFTPSDSLIDWEMAAGIAFNLSQTETVISREHEKELTAKYKEILSLIRPLIADFVGKPWFINKEPVFVFNREDWILANIETIQSLINPLIANYWEALKEDFLPSSLMSRTVKKTNQTLLTTQIGISLGYLATKVLAQYDLALPCPSEIFPQHFFYFVEPNILKLEERLSLSQAPLRFWIALHEATHSFQFHSYPWIRNYLHSLLNQYVAQANQIIDGIKWKIKRGSNKGYGLWFNFFQLSFKEVIKKIQAFMSLLEGFSDYVMFNVGKEFPAYDRMALIFRERSRRISWAERLLGKLVGFDFKVQQYFLGEKFVSQVIEWGGRDFFNQIWQSEENLPLLEEISQPEAWIERMKKKV